MRLRLHIVRKDLPVRKVIWTSASLDHIVEANISNLLHAINVAIPLESPDCRLEDYVVELGGFEVLCFQKFADVFENDVEVVIRPLLPEEREERQPSSAVIATTGRKLIDGAPPLDRQHGLPANDPFSLHIPAAKRHKSGKEGATSTLPSVEDEQAKDDSRGQAGADRMEFQAVLASTTQKSPPRPTVAAITYPMVATGTTETPRDQGPNAKAGKKEHNKRCELRRKLQSRKLIPGFFTNTQLDAYLVKLGLDISSSVPVLLEAIANIRSQDQLKPSGNELPKQKDVVEKERQSVQATTETSVAMFQRKEGGLNMAYSQLGIASTANGRGSLSTLRQSAVQFKEEVVTLSTPDVRFPEYPGMNPGAKRKRLDEAWR